MNLRLVFPTVVLAIGSISAQQPATEPASRTGLVVGRAVDGTTGRPLSGVTVSLTSVPAPGVSSVPAQASSQRVLTGSDGVFVFGGVGKGSYNVFATKSSYVNGAYGKRSAATGGTQGEPLQLAEGERKGGLTIALWRYASIGGRVADDEMRKDNLRCFSHFVLLRIPVRDRRCFRLERWRLRVERARPANARSLQAVRRVLNPP
jgi:hypothetical protein